jgi:hypothetical protein
MAQSLNILRARRGRCARNAFSEFSQGFFARRKVGVKVIVLYVLGERGVLDFLTEILPVRLDSIETVVRPGNYCCDDLALGT